MPKRNLHVAAKKARMPSSCGTEGAYNLLTKLVDSRIPTGMKRAEQTVPADDEPLTLRRRPNWTKAISALEHAKQEENSVSFG